MRQMEPHILISFGQPSEKRETQEQQQMQEPTIMMVAISPVLWGGREGERRGKEGREREGRGGKGREKRGGRGKSRGEKER